MIITHKSLPRRTFLRGVGVAIALPMLDAMSPALAAPARSTATPNRLCFVYAPTGMIMDNWWPKGAGAAFDVLADPEAARTFP